MDFLPVSNAGAEAWHFPSLTLLFSKMLLRFWRAFFLGLNVLPFPRSRYCCICKRDVLRFVPYRGGSMFMPPLARALKAVGSDVDHFECPHCGASDRDRHLVLYLRAAGLIARIPGARILHFAPEKHIAELISVHGPSLYIQADKFPTRAGIVELDLTRIAADDQSFDLVIANHVMEHVDDAKQSLAEIYRVLARGGFAILQTPFAPTLTRTFEDPGIQDRSARLHAYGQEDHVRMYGRDIAAVLASQGLVSRVKTHQELLPEIDAGRHGVNSSEPFLLFQKPIESQSHEPS
ncbi:class I SAM-dependent methyltransferase [Variovorax paradoxus]|uniref:class I SAM-dependent methyltransferase n=1 Tax=Variovorax paradoxus TaxID=34073 RepID=UPI0027D7AFB9|nr:class I SAM-dependent methyltransferase [Variovorax paradoxus]